jgi:hypothetical protein
MIAYIVAVAVAFASGVALGYVAGGQRADELVLDLRTLLAESHKRREEMHEDAQLALAQIDRLTAELARIRTVKSEAGRKAYQTRLAKRAEVA